MSVLMLVNNLERGGAENMSIQLANALNNKIRVDYCCTYKSDGPLRPMLDKDIVLHELHKRPGLDVPATLRLRKLILKRSIKLIHANGYTIYIAILVKFILPRNNSIRIVWHDHSGSNFQKIRNKSVISTLLLRLVSRIVDKIVVVDEFSNKWFGKACGQIDKVVLLNNFVDVSIHQDIKASKLPGVAGHRIIQVASIRRIKDQLTALQAIPSILSEFPDLQYFFVGKILDKEYFLELKEFVDNNNLNHNTHFLGSRNDVPQLLSQINIAVLSSIHEGTPLAVLEYGAMGLPVVVTNVGGCTQIIENGISGIVVNPSNPSQMAKALLALLRSSNLRDKLGENLQKTITSKYSKDSTVSTLLSIYQKELEMSKLN